MVGGEFTMAHDAADWNVLCESTKTPEPCCLTDWNSPNDAENSPACTAEARLPIAAISWWSIGDPAWDKRSLRLKLDGKTPLLLLLLVMTCCWQSSTLMYANATQHNQSETSHWRYVNQGCCKHWICIQLGSKYLPSVLWCCWLGAVRASGL